MGSLMLNNVCLPDGTAPPNILLVSLGDDQFDVSKIDSLKKFQHKNFSITANDNLLHRINEDTSEPTIIYFRGYIRNWDIDQNSDPAVIYQSVIKNLASKTLANGVFTLIVYSSTSQKLTILSDPFGISPLYTRTINKTLLWANNPGYLSFSHDSLDLKSFRSLIQTKYLPGNRTLIDGVCRVPAGACCEVAQATIETTYWNRYRIQAPKNDIDFDIESSKADSMSYFSSVINSVLANANENIPIILPLSGGWDSRRILASLLDTKKTIQYYNAPTYNKFGTEVDSCIAHQLDTTYQLNTEFILRDYLQTENIASRKAKTAFGMESHQHIWGANFFEQLPTSAYFFDGLGGDLLSETGFEDQKYYGPENRAELIINDIFDTSWNPLFRSENWPSENDIKRCYEEHFCGLDNNEALPEQIFLELRTRRSTALWGQSLASAKSVLFCPFLDINYVEAMQNIPWTYKLGTNLQQNILRLENPEMAKLRSSHDFNKDQLNRKNINLIRRESQRELKSNLSILITASSALSNQPIPGLTTTTLRKWLLLTTINPKYSWKYKLIVDILIWWIIDRPTLQYKNT